MVWFSLLGILNFLKSSINVQSPVNYEIMKFAILSLNSFSANGSTKQRSYLSQTSRKLEDLFYKSEAIVIIDTEFQIWSYHFLHNLKISEFNIQIKKS